MARIALKDRGTTFADLEFVQSIGSGGFGVVKLVRARLTGTRYALKCIRKREVVEKGCQEALVSERSIIAEADHPFIVKFVRSFKDTTHVYILMELVTGGELLGALEQLGLLRHPQAQFYTGSIILALEFLHSRRIAYLDLKSENCLLDSQGYLKIIDFGMAQRIAGTRCHDMKGTPIFMAPEIILAKGYTTVADLWSLGVCLYEFLIGSFPFGDPSMENHAQIFYEVLRAELCFPPWHAQQPHASEQESLVRGLLTRDPSRRIGMGPNGYEALKRHVFFEGFAWDLLLGRELQPPFIPSREFYAEGANDEPRASFPVYSLEEAMPYDVAKVQREDLSWTDPDPGWDSEF